MKLRHKLDKGPDTLYNSEDKLQYTFDIAINSMTFKYDEDALLQELRDYTRIREKIFDFRLTTANRQIGSVTKIEVRIFE